MSYTWENPFGGRSTTTVRVMSEKYPPTVPPKSSTTSSPARIAREPGSWWGEAPFGPEATIVNSTVSWPFSRRSPASACGHLLLAAAVHPERRQPPERLVGAARGAREQVELLGVLADAEIRDDRAARPPRGPLERPLEPEQVHGPGRVVHGDDPGLSDDRAERRVRVVAVAPPDDLELLPDGRRGGAGPFELRDQHAPGPPRAGAPGRSAVRTAARRTRSGSGGPPTA